MALELSLFAAGYSKGEAFGLILNFTGGTAISLVVFVIPALVYYYTFKSEGVNAEYYYSNIAMFIFGIFTFFGVMIASLTDA